MCFPFSFVIKIQTTGNLLSYRVFDTWLLPLYMCKYLIKVIVISISKYTNVYYLCLEDGIQIKVTLKIHRLVKRPFSR